MPQRRPSYLHTPVYADNTGVCGFADVVWNPHSKTNIINVEMIQSPAVRFISNLKERVDIVSPVREQLSLEEEVSPSSLVDNDPSEWRQKIMFSLQHMMRLHRMNNTPRATTRGEINSISANRSTIRVSSHIQLAICEAPIHVAILSSDMLLHKASHVFL